VIENQTEGGTSSKLESVRVYIRDPALWEFVKAQAKADGRSRSNWVLRVLADVKAKAEE
jgi:hypothetical protein